MLVLVLKTLASSTDIYSLPLELNDQHTDLVKYSFNWHSSSKENHLIVEAE